MNINGCIKQWIRYECQLLALLCEQVVVQFITNSIHNFFSEGLKRMLVNNQRYWSLLSTQL
jgi:hypothetical protein